MATLAKTRERVKPHLSVTSDGPELRFEWRLLTMTVRDVVQRYGHFAHEGNPFDTAKAWIEAGFEADEVEGWLSARCYDPGSAHDLADAGMSPGDARMKTGAGRGDYTDTVGFKVSTGDLEVEEARDLLGAEDGARDVGAREPQWGGR